MVQAIHKMSRPEQAPLTLDGSYTLRLKGAVSMSTQSTNLRADEVSEERKRLTEFVSSFSEKVTKKQIREAAYKVGFGPIHKKLLQEVCAAVWPEKHPPRRKYRDFSKYPMIRPAAGTLPICPHCQSSENKVYILYWQDDGSVIRCRICKGCKGRFYSHEDANANAQHQRRHNVKRANSVGCTEKQCAKCGLILPIESFGKLDSVYYHARCRECNNAVRAINQFKSSLKKHGLTVGEYEEILKKQNGGCAICGETNLGKTHSGGVHRNLLCFDHCHVTDKFRGLLCQKCNRAIGLLGDDVAQLEAAAAYLRSFQAKGV